MDSSEYIPLTSYSKPLRKIATRKNDNIEVFSHEYTDLVLNKKIKGKALDVNPTDSFHVSDLASSSVSKNLPSDYEDKRVKFAEWFDAVLDKRLLNVLSFSFIFCFAISYLVFPLVLNFTDVLSLQFSFFSLSHIFSSLCVTFFLTVIVYCRLYHQFSYTNEASFFSTFKATIKTRMSFVMLYVVSPICLIFTVLVLALYSNVTTGSIATQSFSYSGLSPVSTLSFIDPIFSPHPQRVMNDRGYLFSKVCLSLDLRVDDGITFAPELQMHTYSPFPTISDNLNSFLNSTHTHLVPVSISPDEIIQSPYPIPIYEAFKYDKLQYIDNQVTHAPAVPLSKTILESAVLVDNAQFYYLPLSIDVTLLFVVACGLVAYLFTFLKYFTSVERFLKIPKHNTGDFIIYWVVNLIWKFILDFIYIAVSIILVQLLFTYCYSYILLILSPLTLPLSLLSGGFSSITCPTDTAAAFVPILAAQLFPNTLFFFYIRIVGCVVFLWYTQTLIIYCQYSQPVKLGIYLPLAVTDKDYTKSCIGLLNLYMTSNVDGRQLSYIFEKPINQPYIHNHLLSAIVSSTVDRHIANMTRVIYKWTFSLHQIHAKRFPHLTTPPPPASLNYLYQDNSSIHPSEGCILAIQSITALLLLPIYYSTIPAPDTLIVNVGDVLIAYIELLQAIEEVNQYNIKTDIFVYLTKLLDENTTKLVSAHGNRLSSVTFPPYVADKLNTYIYKVNNPDYLK